MQAAKIGDQGVDVGILLPSGRPFRWMAARMKASESLRPGLVDGGSSGPCRAIASLVERGAMKAGAPSSLS